MPLSVWGPNAIGWREDDSVHSNAQHILELRYTADSFPLYHICIDCTRHLYNAGPKGLHTDHPVLVYKTSEL